MGATAASTRSGRTSLAHLQAIAARGDTRGDEETSRAFPASKEPKYGRQVSMARPCPTVGRRTGGATMNKAVMKLPLMLGVVGAIAFAAATPSWAAEQKGPNAAAGANAQAGAQAKTTGSAAKMSAGTNDGTKTSAGANAGAKMSTGYAASNEGRRTGQKLSKGSQLSSRTHLGSTRTHLSSKQSLRTRTHIGARESFRTRTGVGLREARLRNRSVGVGVEAGFEDNSFAYGYGSQGYGYSPGYGYPGYAGYGYAAGYPGRCTCGAPGVAWGYGYPAYGAADGWGDGGWGPGYASWGWGGTEAGFGVTATSTNVGVSTGSRTQRGTRVGANAMGQTQTTMGPSQTGMTTGRAGINLKSNAAGGGVSTGGPAR